jgi:hypothetical protein
MLCNILQRKFIGTQQGKQSPTFIEREGSLKCSQNLAISVYPYADESSNPIFLRSFSAASNIVEKTMNITTSQLETAVQAVPEASCMLHVPQRTDNIHPT